MRGSRGRGQWIGFAAPGKSQEAIGFLGNTSTDPSPAPPPLPPPPREAIGPLGSNCFSREVHTVLYDIH